MRAILIQVQAQNTHVEAGQATRVEIDVSGR